MEDSPDRMDWKADSPPQPDQRAAQGSLYTHQHLAASPYSHQHVNSTENQHLPSLYNTDQQIRDHQTEQQFARHHTQSQFNRLHMQPLFGHHYNQPQSDHHLSEQQSDQQPNPPHTQVQGEPFNHGRRRNFDEFSHGEQVELNRVNQPLILSGRVYVPPMDLRNLTPGEAHAVRQNVLELRQRNLDAERRGNLNSYDMRGQQWQSYLLQQLLVAGAAIALFSTAFLYGIFRGAVKSGKFAYRNRHQAHATFTLNIESTCNAAKRRVVAFSNSFSVTQRVQPNVKPPSPRRRNGVIRQPPMTSNLALWEDEMQARREELPMAMHGVESNAAEVSHHMMSGAIMDLDVEECINPLYDPLYSPYPMETEALDECVRDRIPLNPPLISIATNPTDERDVDTRRSDPVDLTEQPLSRPIRTSFVDFYPSPLVHKHDYGLNYHLATAGGSGSTDIAILNPNVITSSFSETAVFTPEETSAPPSSDTGSSSSACTTPIGAIESDASSLSEFSALTTMPEPRRSLLGVTKHEPITRTRIDDIYSDLPDQAGKRELPNCEFEDDPTESMAMEIYRATREEMELDLESSVDSEISAGIPSAQAGASVSIGSITPADAILASNTTSPIKNQRIQVSRSSGTVSGEAHEEHIPLSRTTHPNPNDINQASPISATTSMHVYGGEDSSLPGSFIEYEEEDPSSSHDHSQHDVLRSTYTPTHIFEQENSPMPADQLDSSFPISSAQIFEQQSLRPTTPTRNDGQQGSFFPASPIQLPDQQSSPLSSPRPDISPPVTPVPSRRQPRSQLVINTPKQISKKHVMFFQSPRTGRPVTKTKKYILGETMDFPISSSPAPNSASSTETSTLEIDSPTTIEETEAFNYFLAQHEPNTHYFSKKSVSQEKREFETISHISDNPESAGSSTIKTGEDEEAMVEITRPTAGSLEADKPVLETKYLESTADVSLIHANRPAGEAEGLAGSQLIEANESTAAQDGTAMTEGSSGVGADKPVIETEFSEITADSSSKDAYKPAKGVGSSAGSLLSRADKSTAKVDTTMTDGSSFLRADKPVIRMKVTQETAGSSLRETDKPAMEEDVAADRDEAIATTSGKAILKPLKDTLKLAKPEPSRRRSSPNRHSTQPVRKSLRLQNKSARISPPRVVQLTEKLTTLELSGVYGTTAKDSKQQKTERKAEEARAKQAAIEAAEEARRVQEEAEQRARKEAEELEEKARVAKEEAEEKARKEQAEEEERLRKTARRIPKEKVIQPLSPEWEGRVKAAMDTPDMRTVLVTLPSGTNLTRKDFGTLKVVPGRDPSHGWLNDEIILASLQQVVDYGLRVSNHAAGKTPKYHAFNTFFYKNLRDKGAQSIKRWATKVKIGGRALEEVERVFIPVHQRSHWTLLVVSPVARTIEYFDSMGGEADSYIRNAKLWLATEMGARFKEEEWAVPTGTHGVGPRQSNMSDCGVFTCTTARMVALGVDPMAYGGEDMGVQRGRMAAELLNGGLFGDFDPKVEF